MKKVNFDEINKLEFPFSMRLVPLNKAYPNLQKIGEFRPIMVQIYFIKLIETYFILQVDIGLGNQSILNRICEQDGLLIPYQRLFEILRNYEGYTNYFQPRELALFQWSYDQLYIFDRIEKKKVYQGSLLAPFLFDIYFNELIEQVLQLQREKQLIQGNQGDQKQMKKQILLYSQVKIMAYTDDQAIVCNSSIINELSIFFQEVAEEFIFKINLNKTKVLSRSNSQLFWTNLEKIKEFKYFRILYNRNIEFFIKIFYAFSLPNSFFFLTISFLGFIQQQLGLLKKKRCDYLQYHRIKY